VQPNSLSVQKVLDDILSLVLKEKISTTGAGRTDAGVNASVFCAHFDCTKPGLGIRENTVFRLNRFLPADIAVQSIKRVTPDAHARFSALSRTYKYFISRKKDPFTEQTSWFIFGDLNTGEMNRAAAVLLRHSDFTSFSRLHSDNKTNLCRIFSASWDINGDTLIFTIRADRFLRNMVRAIASTMVNVGKGKITVEQFEEIIVAKDRSKAGMSAPAKGLFLTDIEYPGTLFPD
jgi:tRNA pseudouridine38-40 synthase